MREYLSSKDFIFYFILLLLSIEKSIFKFFLKKRLGSHAPIGPKVHLPLLFSILMLRFQHLFLVKIKI